MKLIQLLNAKDAIARLADTRFSNFKTARNIAKVKKALDEEVDFYIQEEKKIITTYAVKNDKGEPVFLEGGRVQLATLDDKENFEREILSLRDTDVDRLNKINVMLSDFKDSGDIPTPSDIVALEGIIEFVE